MTKRYELSDAPGIWSRISLWNVVETSGLAHMIA